MFSIRQQPIESIEQCLHFLYFDNIIFLRIKYHINPFFKIIGVKYSTFIFQ